MKPFALLILALAITTACTDGVDSSAFAKPAGAATDTARTVDLDTNVVFDKTDGVLKYRSPFDAETTLKLNAIVIQAKTSITEFDDEIAPIRASVDAAAAGQNEARAKALAGLARLETLRAPVVKAKADMVVARTELVASKLYFNNIVLSGMEDFINRVDGEFGDEIKAMKTKLKVS